MRNVTISVEEAVLERAREVARRQGTSLNSLLRRYLETLAGTAAGRKAGDELLALMREQGGRSGGQRIRRDEAYEDRV